MTKKRNDKCLYKKTLPSMKITGNIIDLHQREIFFGAITVENGFIKNIEKKEGKSDDYLLPGFVDAHVHIESSMLVPGGALVRLGKETATGRLAVALAG